MNVQPLTNLEPILPKVTLTAEKSIDCSKLPCWWFSLCNWTEVILKWTEVVLKWIEVVLKWTASEGFATVCSEVTVKLCVGNWYQSGTEWPTCDCIWSAVVLKWTEVVLKWIVNEELATVCSEVTVKFCVVNGTKLVPSVTLKFESLFVVVLCWYWSGQFVVKWSWILVEVGSLLVEIFAEQPLAFWGYLVRISE